MVAVDTDTNRIKELCKKDNKEVCVHSILIEVVNDDDARHSWYSLRSQAWQRRKESDTDEFYSKSLGETAEAYNSSISVVAGRTVKSKSVYLAGE